VIRVERGGLRLLLFPSLEAAGLACAVSTRPLDVKRREDRSRFVAACGLDPDRTASPLQIHRADVVRVDAPTGDEPPAADGLVTGVEGLALCLRAADCSLIVVADPERRTLGVAHAGWKGSARGVVVNLVRTLEHHYGSRPETLRAAVGPTIGASRYPVGPEVPGAFLRLRSWAGEHVCARDGRLHFDLAGANAHFLREAGVPADRIEVSDLCTYDDAQLLHSFRRDGARAGHHGLVAAWPRSAS
jgi:YfiH family protein